MARPTDYKPEFCDQAEKLCKLLGATDKDLAEFFDVCEATINNWKIEYPEFLESIKRGKLIADMTVANKLFDRATGAEIVQQQAIKIKDSYYSNGRKVSETERVEIVELVQEQAPDTTAAIFWLKNRQSKAWRDKQDVEHGVTDPLAALISQIAGATLKPNSNDTE